MNAERMKELHKYLLKDLKKTKKEHKEASDQLKVEKDMGKRMYLISRVSALGCKKIDLNFYLSFWELF